MHCGRHTGHPDDTDDTYTYICILLISEHETENGSSTVFATTTEHNQVVCGITVRFLI